MSSTLAWQRHGCYKLGSDQYFNVRLDKALLGCEDDWNSLDHFDPTAPLRGMLSHFHYIRSIYPAVMDGFGMVQLGNWTHMEQFPGSNGTQTEMGMWSVSRSSLSGIQNFTGDHVDNVWLLYTNENTTTSYQFNCTDPLWISSPYQSGVTVRNLLPPFEQYQLQPSLDSFFKNNAPPFTGCLPAVSFDAYGFKALVPVSSWVSPLPIMTKFTPGHDHRIMVAAGDPNATNIDVSFEYNIEMDCNSLTNALTFQTSSSGKGGNVTVDPNSIKCGAVQNPDPALIFATQTSVWSWSGTLNNVPDGLIQISLGNIATQGGNATTGVCSYLILETMF